MTSGEPPFRIGWYAGISHDRDAPQVRRALAWASRQPNVEVVNIGLNPEGWNFNRRQVAWSNDFRVLRRELGRLDVGVCPLVATPLTKYRSDLKVLEYAMAGAMPIVQRYEPYWEWFDSDFVRTASTPDEWEQQIRWAVANRDEVRVRAQQAREYVLEKRTFRTEIERWREAIAGGET
jgi:glycosyltransferase involved in cell wall biosynthesis